MKHHIPNATLFERWQRKQQRIGIRGYLVIAAFALVLGWTTYQAIAKPDPEHYYDQATGKVWSAP